MLSYLSLKLYYYYFFILCFASSIFCIDIWVSESGNSNSTVCGLSETTPCIGLQNAISQGYLYSQSGQNNITIQVLPGYYKGQLNSNISINYSVSISATNNTSTYIFSDIFTLFKIYSANVSISGFIIDGVENINPLLSVEDGILNINNFMISNTFAKIAKLTNGELNINSCNFSFIASRGTLISMNSNSFINFYDSYITSCSGVNFINDTELFGSSISIHDSLFSQNSFDIAYLSHEIIIHNSLFSENILLSSLINCNNISINNSNFTNEHFGTSYIFVDNKCLISFCYFNNIVATSLESNDGTIIYVDAQRSDEIISQISQCIITNCSTNQIFYIINTKLTIDTILYSNSYGAFGRISHSSDADLEFNLTNSIIDNVTNGFVSVTLVERRLFNRVSLINLSNLLINNFVGEEPVLLLNNLGGDIYISNITLVSCSNGIIAQGNVTMDSVYMRDSTCTSLGCFQFSSGMISISNININNITSNSGSVIYIKDKTYLTGNNMLISNCTSNFYSIISVFNSLTSFSNLNISNSSGDSGGSIYFHTGELDIYNSNFLNNTSKLGGSLFIKFGIINIDNVLFENNKAEYGGAIYIQDSKINLSNSTCTDNISFQDGGCLFSRNFVTGTAYNNIISNNNCLGSGGGIALRNINQINFSYCYILNNTALNGGGIYFSGNSKSSFYYGNINFNKAISSGGGVFIKEQANPSIFYSSISYNNAESTGGGMKIADISYPILYGLIINSNTSPNEGGGIAYADGSIANLSNSIISHNSVNASGGGIVFSISTHGNIENVTLENNQAKSKGGGIAFYNNCYPTFKNVTIIENKSPEGAGISSKDAANPRFYYTNFIHNIATSAGGGGIMYDYSNGKFINCTFEYNSATIGGSIALNDFAGSELSSCYFSNNLAEWGGCLFISSQTPIIISDSIFYNNKAYYGGGIVVTDKSNVTILHSNCTDNIASKHGGCIEVEDEAVIYLTNILISNNKAGDSGLGNGGGIRLADRSKIFMINSLINNNFAPEGGGIYLEPFTYGFINSTIISLNSAQTGSGISSTGTFIGLYNILFDSNFGYGFGSRGGGLCVIANEIIASNICVDCIFINNSAYRGGGAFLSVNAHSFISRDNYYNPKENSAFCDGIDEYNNYNDNYYNFEATLINTTFISNNATRGGGIYIEQPSIAVGSQNISFLENYASEYGAGLFIVRDHSLASPSDYWMKDSLFFDNNAYYGGSNVGWSIIDKCSDDFCYNCTFGEPSFDFDGYENDLGWASPPISLLFNTECPGDVTLTDDTFDVSLNLVDKFTTLISGHLVEKTDIIVSLSTKGNCSVSSIDGSISGHKINLSGAVTFTNLIISGYNNNTCTLVFYISNTDSKYFVSNQTCDILLNGCPKNQLIQKSSDGYDSCITNQSQEQHINQAIVLITIIFVLLIVICTFIFFGIFWDKREKSKATKPINFFNTIENKEITLNDILNDPDIDYIEWDSLIVGERIGFGATGIVLSGKWQKDTTVLIDVALKEINIGNSEYIDNSILTMMLSEIKLMCAIDNIRIVEFYGISLSDDNRFYIILELMHRGSIKDLILRKGNNLTWKLRLKFAISAAKGISYLHNNDIIHRDLKPHNLLVNKEWKCKIADFGISTINGNTPNMSVIGTPVYMAPEIFNDNNYTEKVDVYAFGMVLYALYSSKNPYYEHEKLPENQLLVQIFNGLRPNTKEFPSTLKTLLDDCWNEKSKLRPSFKEIIVRLRRLKSLELPENNENQKELLSSKAPWINDGPFSLFSSSEEDEEEEGNKYNEFEDEEIYVINNSAGNKY